MMRLRGGELVSFADFAQADDGRRENRIALSDGEGVKSNSFADAAATRVSVTEMNRDRLVRLAGHDPDWCTQTAPCELDADDIASLEFLFISQRRADEESVVPGQFGNGPW